MSKQVLSQLQAIKIKRSQNLFPTNINDGIQFKLYFFIKGSIFLKLVWVSIQKPICNFIQPLLNKFFIQFKLAKKKLLQISRHNNTKYRSLAGLKIMKSDRFIPNFNDKNRIYGNIRTQKQILKNYSDDPKVAKLYRKIIIQPNQKQNFASCNSLKAINHNDSQYNQKHDFLALLGIDTSRFQVGPTILNKSDRILEALSLNDNFYLNLLDCSFEKILAVGLSKGIYIWKPSGQISRIVSANDICSIKWNPINSNIIGYGSQQGFVDIWDIQKNQRIRSYNCHQGRVGAMDWFKDPYCFLSGGEDSCIFSYDLRKPRKTGIFKYHDQQVCSLKVQSFNVNQGSQTFASGSNDQKLTIWNNRSKNPVCTYKHSAAIKGMAWHPTKSGVLAAGGGTEDRTIKIRNITSNQLIKSVDSGSQVCNLLFINDGQKLVSSHGYNRFQVNIWETSTMIKKKTLIGHKKRVLYLTAEPDGNTIITGAGDQTIRFWKINEDKTKQSQKQIVQQTIMTLR